MKIKILFLLFASLFFINYVSASLTDGLVSYYKLDENSGSAVYDSLFLNNGTYKNAISIISGVGMIENSYALNGTTHVNFTSATNIVSGNGSRSVSLRFNSNNTNIYNGLFGQGSIAGPGENDEWYFYILEPGIWVGYAGTQYECSVTLNNFTWYNFVGIYNGTGTNMYLNGVSLCNTTAFNSDSNNTAIRIGSRSWIPSSSITDSLIGYIDEVAYFNRTLTQSEMIILNTSAPYPFDSSTFYNSLTSDNSSSTYPKYYDFIMHSTKWITNATLSTYIFSWNNSGSWENLTTTVFSNNWSNVTKNITAVKGSNIGWYIWANDSEGKVNSTSIKEYIVRNSPPQSSIGMFNVSSIYNGSYIKVNASISDLDGLVDISSVIATIKKNNSVLGTMNTTQLNYSYSEYNPILPTDTFAGLELSTVYESGYIHMWYRKFGEDGTPISFIVYSNSTNGINFSTDVNVTMPQMEIPKQLEYVIKVNSTYYMFMANFTGAESTHNLVVFNSTDKINWEYACPSVITNTGYQKNPAVWYNSSDGSWHGLFEQGSGVFTTWYWNSSDLCSMWTKYNQSFGNNAGNANIKFRNGEFIVYYGDMSGSTEDMNISVARGTNLNNLSVVGRYVINTNGETWAGTHVSNPEVVIIEDEEITFDYKYYIYFSGHDNMTGVAFDSEHRSFDEAHFGLTGGNSENITLSQVGSTNEWSGIFTNTSYIGLYNLTKIYVNDTDNSVNYSTYSKISFTTIETEVINSSSCSVYFNTTSPITYPSTFIVYTNCTSAYSLYKNGTAITNGTTINSGAGYYNFTVQRTDTANYTNIVNTQFFTVNKSPENCEVLFNETSPINYPNRFKAWANCTSAFVLKRNGTTISNNSEQSLLVSAYNFSFLRNDTSNYSIIYNESQFIVNGTLDIDAPNLVINYPLNQTYLIASIIFNISANDSSGIDMCLLSLDGESNITMSNSTNEIYNYTNSSMINGNHNATFYCNDTLNNLNITSVYYIVSVSSGDGGGGGGGGGGGTTEEENVTNETLLNETIVVDNEINLEEELGGIKLKWWLLIGGFVIITAIVILVLTADKRRKDGKN